MQAADTLPTPPPTSPGSVSSCVASGKSGPTGHKTTLAEGRADRQGEGRRDSLCERPSVRRKQMPCEHHLRGRATGCENGLDRGTENKSWWRLISPGECDATSQKDNQFLM